MANIADIPHTALNHRAASSPVAEAAGQNETYAATQPLEKIKPARRQRLRTVEPAPDPDIGSVEPAAAKSSEPAVVPRISKCDGVLSLLRREGGATIREIMAATNWQAHSVRGFLSGTVRKKMGVDLISEVTGEGTRRYRIASGDGNDSSNDMRQPEPTDLPAFLPFNRDRHVTATASNTIATDEAVL